MLSLLGALWGGLVRLGWPLVPVPPALVSLHGPLMVSGFLGTVIGLERAVALGVRWGYAVPLVTGLGSLALMAGLPVVVGAGLQTLGSVGLGLLFVALLRRQTASFTVVMAFGALAWLGTQCLWLAGQPLWRLWPWWAAFLVLTIAGERLELSRLVQVSAAARTLFLALVGVLGAGLVTTLVAPAAAGRVVGVALLGLAVWLLRYDVARRTVHQPGLTRFVATCLLSGYAWLAVAGGLALASGDAAGGGRYDAMLHALFLGFVFTMIFGHAPIIFPAVLGWPVAFRRTFYAHLLLLHASLLLRLAGDLGAWAPGRRWGGLLNALGVLLFLANTVAGVLGPPRSRPPA